MSTGTTDRITTPTPTTTHYFWERRRAGALPWVLGAAGLLGLAVAHDVPLRHTIEQHLESRASTALADVPGVKVDFTGRDGRLTGTLPAGANVADLVARVEALDGVRVVIADFGGGTGAGTASASPSAEPSTSSSPSVSSEPSAEPSPSVANTSGAPLPSVTAISKAGTITLTGRVPSQEAKDALVAAATATFGPGKVVDRLTIADEVSPAGLTEFGALIGTLGKGSAATAALDAGTLVLSGTVPDAAAKSAAEAAATKLTGDAGKVTSQLTTGAPGTGGTAGTGGATTGGVAAQRKLNTLPQITFETGSTDLTPAGLRAVRQAAAILKANPTVKVRIQGHTDDVGDARENLTLSTARAERVRAVLHQLGIAHERMSYIGYGESRPKLANTSAANRAVNRRVEFHVL